MNILFLLLLLALAPIILIIAGIIMAFNSNIETSKKGGRFILYGFLLLLVEVLIGFAICSNMRFGGFH